MPGGDRMRFSLIGSAVLVMASAAMPALSAPRSDRPSAGQPDRARLDALVKAADAIDGGLDERIELRAVGLAGGRPVRSRRGQSRHRRRRHDKNRTPDQAQPHPTTPRHYSSRTDPANRLFT